MALAVSGGLGEGERFQRQDREDARHQIEDQPAEKGEDDRERQPDRGIAARGRARLVGDGCGRARARIESGVEEVAGRGNALPLEDEHALEHLELLGLAVAPLQGELQPVALPLGLLRRRVDDLAPGERQESDCLGLLRQRLADAVDLDRHRVALGPDASRPLRGLGQPLDGRDDRVGGGGRLSLGGAGNDGDVEPRFTLLGNADVLADEPLGLGEEARGAGLCILRHHQAREQQHLVGVTEVHQGPDRNRLRHRPVDGAELETVRRLPLDGRRLARVARIDPVGVPAGVDDLFQRDPRLSAGLYRLVGGEELDLHTRLRLRFGRGDEKRQGEQGKEGSKGQ